MTAGTSINADRFSAYRLGSMLPLVAEYPLILPGYFFQELSADQFILWHGRYAVTLDEKKQWQIAAMASTAAVSFIDEQDQPERWFSGVGGGVAEAARFADAVAPGRWSPAQVQERLLKAADVDEAIGLFAERADVVAVMRAA